MHKTKIKLNRTNMGVVTVMILALAVSCGLWPFHRQVPADNPMNSVHAVTPTDIAVFQAVMKYATATIDSQCTYQRTTTTASEFAGGAGREDLLKQVHNVTANDIAQAIAMEKAMQLRNAKSVPIPNFAAPLAAGHPSAEYKCSFTLPAYNSDGSEALIYCDGMFFSVKNEYGEWAAEPAIEEQTPGMHSSF